MMINYNYNKINCSGIFALSLSISLVATLVAGVDNPFRSVEKCDTQSQIVPQLWVPLNCRLHCERTYIFTSFETNRINRRFFQHKVNKSSKGDAFECCCKFNFPWPAELVRPEAVDRVHNKPQKTSKPYDCLPLGPIKIGLSSRTVDAYERVCGYLERREPLTMFEAHEFANLTSYLNMMQPKSPQILRTIKHKGMKIVNKEVLERLDEVMQDKDKIFLDSFKPLEKYDGYQLRATTVTKIANLLRYHLREATKNGVIAKAIDEYVLSYVLVDLVAASKLISQLNRQDLAIPEHLLRGDYDQYNEEFEREAFTMPPEMPFNCKLLGQTLNRLNIYLSSISSALSSLTRKLAYEHMGEVNPNMLFLLKTQKAYKLLQKVNCGRRQTQMPTRTMAR